MRAAEGGGVGGSGEARVELGEEEDGRSVWAQVMTTVELTLAKSTPVF